MRAAAVPSLNGGGTDGDEEQEGANVGGDKDDSEGGEKEQGEMMRKVD